MVVHNIFGVSVSFFDKAGFPIEACGPCLISKQTIKAGPSIQTKLSGDGICAVPVEMQTSTFFDEVHFV